MRSLLAVARRVLLQFRHDPRTLAIMLIAPCVVLWLFSVLLGVGDYAPRIATVDLPSEFQTSLENQTVRVTDTDYATAEGLIAENQVDAVITLDGSTLDIQVEGADANKTGATMKQVQSAIVDMQQSKADEIRDKLEQASETSSILDDPAFANLPEAMRSQIEAKVADAQAQIPGFDEIMPITGFETSYYHGDESWTSFDFYGPVFIGIFIFVFVFLTSSMSLLTERSGGTVERLIATPVKSWQIVGGYVLGFGLLTLVQSAIILWACISLIGFPNAGSLPLVVLITVSMALVSLTLGLMVSGLAHTPFQVIQLMILFVVPQILLSGIFDLTQTPGWMQAIAAVFPLGYGAEALRDVMLRGVGFTDIAQNFTILWGFIVVFFALACVSFRKKRTRQKTDA